MHIYMYIYKRIRICVLCITIFTLSPFIFIFVSINNSMFHQFTNSSGKKMFNRLGHKRADFSITVNSGNVRDTTARANGRKNRRVAFRLHKADTEARLELMTKKETTRELDETAFQLAVTNEELKKNEKELEERLAEVMSLHRLRRQQWDPQEKLTCLLTAVRNWLLICQETVTQNAMRYQGADLGVVRRMNA